MRSLPLVAFLMAVWMVSLGSAWAPPSWTGVEPPVLPLLADGREGEGPSIPDESPRFCPASGGKVIATYAAGGNCPDAGCPGAACFDLAFNTRTVTNKSQPCCVGSGSCLGDVTITVVRAYCAAPVNNCSGEDCVPRSSETSSSVGNLFEITYEFDCADCCQCGPGCPDPPAVCCALIEEDRTDIVPTAVQCPDCDLCCE